MSSAAHGTCLSVWLHSRHPYLISLRACVPVRTSPVLTTNGEIPTDMGNEIAHAEKLFAPTEYVPGQSLLPTIELSRIIRLPVAEQDDSLHFASAETNGHLGGC